MVFTGTQIYVSVKFVSYIFLFFSSSMLIHLGNTFWCQCSWPEKENTKWCHSYATSELFLLMIQTPAIACMVWYGNMTIWNTNIKNLCPILLPVNFSLYFDSWFYILIYIVIGIMTVCGSNNVVFGNTWSSLFHTERGGIYKPFGFFLIHILHPFFFLV